ncbi:MAG TPA: response regulator transcription factor [Gaiellaceae bacterium]|nr:response regulator transcription factor [Gaiellaceae bacterium]
MGAAATPIVIADGDSACCARLAELLRRIGYAVEVAETGRAALELSRQLRPGVVLLEVNLPEISGYEICRELRDTFGSEISIIFVSGDRTRPADRAAGLLIGADDYIVKPFDDDEFLARVRVAVRRASPANGNGNGNGGMSVEASLTPREREVLRLLASGLSQSEIAARLFISPKTVGGHIQRVLTKLGVHSRAQAVARAHEYGLADVEANGLMAPLRAV